jgi:hypothetical protein
MWWLWLDWWCPPQHCEVITVDFLNKRVIGRVFS